MRSEDTTTRVVRSWLEAGSTAVPDRVLDAVLAELPSTPQRRHRWLPWRYRHMSMLARATGIAAVALVAVGVALWLRPGGPSVGGPSPVDGTVTFVLGGTNEIAVAVAATADGSSLSGTSIITNDGGEVTVHLACAAMADEQTWMLGGTIEASSSDGQPVGAPVAVIVRDGSPQHVALWFGDASEAGDCAAFLDAIPGEATQDAALSPVREGAISLPPPIDE